MTDRTRLRFVTEVVGLSAVIASLGFVGMEIRQNTAAVRSATTQAVSDQAMELTLSIATDEHLPRLVSELNNGLTRSEFDPHDYYRLRLVVIAGLRRQENLYAQVRSGVLDPAALRNVSFSFYQNPYVRELWAEIRDTFNPEFTRYWDEIVAEP
jgi:hypothetical protein